MKLIRAVFVLALLMLLPAVSIATEEGKTIRYGGGGLGAVVFDGRMHVGKGYVCKDCHLQLFTTAKKARVRASDHFSETLCFKCHDNKTAPRDCVTCHRKVVSSNLVYSDFTRWAQSRPLSDEERPLYLTGKLGVSEQTRACLSCHGKPELEPQTERGKILNLHVSQPKFSSGTHGAFACASCHTGLEGDKSFTQVPHAVKRPAGINCQSCHNVRLGPEIASFDKSAHVQKLKEKMACASCHDTHTVGKTKQGYLASVVEYNARCLACHADPQKFAALSGRALNTEGMAHAFLTKWRMHSASVLCADCHSPTMSTDRHLILEKKDSLRNCAACHTSMDSLILTRASLRDGNNNGFADSYLPAVRASKNLDVFAGYSLAAVLVLIALHALARVFGKKAPRGGILHSEYVYPRFVRFIHWINAVCFALLIWSGLGIRFDGLGFVPGLEAATTVHSTAGIVLMLNFAIFLITACATGDIRQYLPHGEGLFARLSAQMGYSLRDMFTGAEHPFAVTAGERFNPVQQVAYLLVFIIGMPLLILSGILMLLPESATSGIASRQCLATVHYSIAICYALFLAGHVYLATTGETPLALIKGMFTGFHEHVGLSAKESDNTTPN